jgi:mRNA-degrading endonuclease RelE of RelBE toxin-antitoxin system
MTPEYAVRYAPRAHRDLMHLPKLVAQTVLLTIRDLAADPHNPPSRGHRPKKLKGTTHPNPIYSLRVGRDVRVLLAIYDSLKVMYVLEVDQRKSVYRDF